MVGVDSYFIDSYFIDSYFIDSYFIDCNFIDCNFIDCNFIDCNFIDCNFIDCNFIDCNFIDCNFIDCNFVVAEVGVVVVVSVVDIVRRGKIVVDDVVVDNIVQVDGLSEHFVGDRFITLGIDVAGEFSEFRVIGFGFREELRVARGEICGGIGEIVVDRGDIVCQSFSILSFGRHDRFDFDFVEHFSQQGFGFFDRGIDCCGLDNFRFRDLKRFGGLIRIGFVQIVGCGNFRRRWLWHSELFGLLRYLVGIGCGRVVSARDDGVFTWVVVGFRMIPTLECKQVIIVVVSHRLVIGPVEDFNIRLASTYFFNRVDGRDVGVRINGVVVRGLNRSDLSCGFIILGRCRGNVAWQLDEVLGDAGFRRIDLDQNDIGRRKVVRLVFFVERQRSFKFFVRNITRRLGLLGVARTICYFGRFDQQHRIDIDSFACDLSVGRGDRRSIDQFQFGCSVCSNFALDGFRQFGDASDRLLNIGLRIDDPRPRGVMRSSLRTDLVVPANDRQRRAAFDSYGSQSDGAQE
ncbi:pentapeptide repeat-containing protein [Rosistilla oblonga]|uniref:pentapeptide repeat-containing protein n=1 Tax=Rosistilla oblonga TaxID=2527990 RepID=UPI003B8A7BCA